MTLARPRYVCHPRDQQFVPDDLVVDFKIQVITYKAEFVDNLSAVMEDLNMSPAVGIWAGKLSLSGGTTYINERKFKDSHINLFINVKVVNDKTVLNQELLRFNEIKSVMEDRKRFTDTYGDGFVSGFVSGGGKWYISTVIALACRNSNGFMRLMRKHSTELSAIVNIKLMNQSDLPSVKAS